jgi:hypothetical protein
MDIQIIEASQAACSGGTARYHGRECPRGSSIHADQGKSHLRFILYVRRWCHKSHHVMANTPRSVWGTSFSKSEWRSTEAGGLVALEIASANIAG